MYQQMEFRNSFHIQYMMMYVCVLMDDLYERKMTQWLVYVWVWQWDVDEGCIVEYNVMA